MSDVVKLANRGAFKPGQSGNAKGRPAGGTSASEINRGYMKRYGSWERLARVAAGMNLLTENEQAERIAKGKAPFPDPTMSEVLQALKLQAAYGYGQPTQTVEGIEGTLAKTGGITIIKRYVDKQIIQNNNITAGIRVGIAGASPGPAEGVEGSSAVQCLPDGAPLGQVDPGKGSDRGNGE